MLFLIPMMELMDVKCYTAEQLCSLCSVIQSMCHALKDVPSCAFVMSEKSSCFSENCSYLHADLKPTADF